MKALSESEEKDLLIKLRDGDHATFGHIYHTYKRQLLGNLYKILKDRAVVEELVQDLFMNLWSNRTNIDPEKPIKAYLFRIAANLAKNTIRSAYYDQRMRAVMMAASKASYTHIEEQLFQQENRALLNQLLDKLPPKRREVYTLCKLEGKSYKEVSQLLRISEVTVNDHINKANAYFRQINTNPLLWIALSNLFFQAFY